MGIGHWALGGWGDGENNHSQLPTHHSALTTPHSPLSTQDYFKILNSLLPGYNIRLGSTLDRALLVKYMQRSYEDSFPQQDFSHLGRTVDQYFSKDTPLWWVEEDGGEVGRWGELQPITPSDPVACLWVGNAIDQVGGSRHAHIFLLYVVPEHRRRGIGTALMGYVENWARQRGDRQIGLQVFQSNQTALDLYHQLGYQTQSLWMVKSLQKET